ncbi:hypothetical protein AWJ20_3578 [Sugiyamaella lignohabitans]|uniref:HIT-type domain-containing protein n=1 Tax=Sugiyamaella lignohabitans TaxID=796027 RepID=A0A167G0B2_9ASCO|nr:uncharacterized protein AWJ20_3578 [Sugiyamaella lignohabitans]ANB15934.1 hypothetical protein AWJ20_3578 [Sugiyamaella lignohabitans]
MFLVQEVEKKTKSSISRSSGPVQTNAFGRKQRAAVTAAVTAASAESTSTSSRLRAVNKRLAELERENYHENIKIDIPKRNLEMIGGGPARTGLTPASRKVLASRKTLANHFDDDPASTKLYLDVASSPSAYPSRPMCSICGYWGKLTCIRCGARYCGRACEETHLETRCLKVYA